MTETYTFTENGSVIRGSDKAYIPNDPGNADWQAYLASGIVATPYVAPAPVYQCCLWQLQAVMTSAQWSAVQAAIASLNNVAVSAFFQHGTNVIPSNSTTLLQLGQAINLTAEQVTALVQQASAVVIP
jgi:hypothetical protein